MKKRKGKLMWACRDAIKGDYEYVISTRPPHPHPEQKSAWEAIWGQLTMDFNVKQWSGPILNPGEGPVRVRVTIERERRKR